MAESHSREGLDWVSEKPSWKGWSGTGTGCPVAEALLTFVIRSNKSQDVLVPQHHGLVNLSLPEPRTLLTGRENLHSHVPSTPPAPPHLPKAAFADDLLKDNGPSHGPLDKQGQAWGQGIGAINPCGSRNPPETPEDEGKVLKASRSYIW